MCTVLGFIKCLLAASLSNRVDFRSNSLSNPARFESAAVLAAAELPAALPPPLLSVRKIFSQGKGRRLPPKTLKIFVKISVSQFRLSSPEPLEIPVSPVFSLSEACAPGEEMPKFPFQVFGAALTL